ncbi:hypothetical protein [Nocardioides jejuensis]|uniref:Heavy-metal-associated domain-containing protein n=1 Tax=Nocardioides jejuensis TaxID=2502782 RepID=A0A4R1CFQ5_9ACTN|nr:hypothetical protein [Nocardioides jejuensis]TCJ30144.1 hypothetical protein EPD65_04440 [Nocardioides jejuensis]
MTQLMRNRIVFILVAVGAFVLAFGFGQVAGHKKDATPKDSSKPAPTYSVKLLDGDVLKDKQPLRFEVLDPKGKVVTEFDTVHEKKLHLIVVEKGDPRVYEHVHPTMASDGTWSTTLELGPGFYRLYADTKPSGADGQVLTADFSEPGISAGMPAFNVRATDTATVDGYDVALKADGMAYTFTVTKDGKPVTLQPYLGAGGHLVGIRTESLDYLHAHAMAAQGNTVGFHVAPGNSGLWVLHLDFQVDGKVHDATFVRRIEVDGPGSGMGEHMDMGDMEGHDHH